MGTTRTQGTRLWDWRYLLLALALLLALRQLWQTEPGLATAAAYWFVLLVVVQRILRRFRQLYTPAGVLMIGGTALNAVVTLANGGFMPIRGELPGAVYEPLTDDTKLRWLADVLPLEFSVGDLLIFAGLAALAWQIVWNRRAEAA